MVVEDIFLKKSFRKWKVNKIIIIIYNTINNASITGTGTSSRLVSKYLSSFSSCLYVVGSGPPYCTVFHLIFVSRNRLLLCCAILDRLMHVYRPVRQQQQQQVYAIFLKLCLHTPPPPHSGQHDRQKPDSLKVV